LASADEPEFASPGPAPGTARRSRPAGPAPYGGEGHVEE
jgi:hypothetical protein